MESNLAYKLDENVREEIIGGRVVAMASPAMKHIIIGGKLYRIFANYLEGKPCTALPDGPTVILEEGKEEYKPDMIVVCDRNKIQDDGVHGAPDLAVEILSPSTGRYDKGRKKDAYEKHGVREYWIVSPGDKSIEQYVLENGRFVLRDVYALCPPHMLKRMKESERAELVTEFQCTLFDDLTVRLEDVFRDIDFL